MSFYRRHGHEIPALNTASLPDLIFTILFFFMLVVHMRKVTVKVKYQVPAGTELTRLVNKSAVSYIYIGKPMNGWGQVEKDRLQVQMNDKLTSIPEIKQYLIRSREEMSSEDRQAMTVSIKADQQTDMGTIIDLKQTLREANALKVNYSGVYRTKKNK